MHRSVSYIAFLAIIAGFAVLLPAQPGGENGSGAEAPVRQEPTQQEIDAAIAEIRKGDSRKIQAEQVDALGKKGKAASTALLALLADASTPDPVFAVVSEWIYENNIRTDTAMDALCTVIQSGAAPRRDLARATLDRLARNKGALLPALMKRLSKGAAEANVAALIVAIEGLAADRPVERSRVVDALIGLLVDGAENGLAQAVRGSLERQTLHRFPDGKSWRSWYDGYAKQHGPAGFSFLELHRAKGSSDREATTAEALLAIGRFVENGIPPFWYLSVADYPDPRVRTRAAQGMLQAGIFKAAGDDAEKRQAAVEPLLRAVSEDPDTGVQKEALVALGSLAGALGKKDEELRGRLASLLASRLDANGDLDVLLPTVRGLGRCAEKGTGESLGQLYIKLTTRKGAGAVRKEVILALATLKEASHIVVRGVADEDLSVKETAARSIGLLQDPALAPDLAKAWKETDPSSFRRSVVLNLEVLGNYAPKLVLETLQNAAKAGREESVDALRALVQALAAQPPLAPLPDAVDGLRAFLVAYVPKSVDEDGRKRLASALGATPTPSQLRVAIGWAMGEKTAALRQALVQTVASHQGDIGIADLQPLCEYLVQVREFAGAESLLLTLIKRASASEGPESDTAFLPALREILVQALVGQGKNAEAETVLTGEIDRQKEQAAADLFEARGRVRLVLTKQEGARDDFEQALVRGGTSLPPLRRKELLIQVARLQLILNRPKDALARATEALPLQGPPDEDKIRLITLAAGLRLPRDLVALERAVTDYERLAKTAAKIPDGIKASAETAIRLRDLVSTLDGSGSEGERKSLAELGKAPAEGVAPWLVKDLAALAGKTPPAPASVISRLTLLKTLFPNATFETPAADAPPETVQKAAESAATWWISASQ